MGSGNKMISPGKHGEFRSIVECPICKKAFLLNTSSVYKHVDGGNKATYFCSYTCWRKSPTGNGTKRQYIVSKPRKRDKLSGGGGVGNT